MKSFLGKLSLGRGVAEKVALGSVAGMVLVRCLIYWNYLKGWGVCFYSDSAVYASLARRVYEGDFFGGIHPIWNPGLPFAMVPFYALLGGWEKAQVAVSMTAVILLIPVMFWWLGKVDKALALGVAVMVAFSARVQELVVLQGVSEPLYMLFLWLAVGAGFLALTKGKVWFWVLAAGGFAGAYLVRTDGMGVLGGFLVLAVAWIWKERARGRKRWVKLVWFLLVFVLSISPYVLVMSKQLGKVTLSGKYVFYGSPPPFVLDEDRMSLLYQDVDSWDFLNAKSPFFDSERATVMFRKFLANGSFYQEAMKSGKRSFVVYKEMIEGDILGRLGVGLAILGFVVGCLRRNWRLVNLYLSVMFVAGLAWVALFMAPAYRYLFFGLTILFCWQVMGLVGLGEGVLRVFGKKKGGEIGVGLLVVVVLVGLWGVRGRGYLDLGRTVVSSSHCNLKEVGEWLKGRGVETVGGIMEAVSFYGGAKFVYRPVATPEKIVEYFKVWGVEYFAINQNDAGYDFIRPLAEPNFSHPDLTLLKQFDDGSLVWKVRLTKEEKLFNEQKRWEMSKE